MAKLKKKFKKNKANKKKQAKQGKSWSFITIFISIILFMFAAYLYSNTKEEKNVQKGTGVLATPITEHNFGNVSAAGGVVTTEFPLVNIGDDDLVISFLDSSCGCTTAKVINEGESGPIFGMSTQGRSPRNWKTVIPSGGKASLKVYYDPMVHKEFRGKATREITITSNASTGTFKKVRIQVNQSD